MGDVVRAEYLAFAEYPERFAEYPERFGVLPKFNDKTNSPNAEYLRRFRDVHRYPWREHSLTWQASPPWWRRRGGIRVAVVHDPVRHYRRRFYAAPI